MLKVRVYRREHTDWIKWLQRRRECHERAGWICEICHVRRSAVTHHAFYDGFGHERPSDLQALCRQCHAELHGYTYEAANDNQLELPLPTVKTG